MITLTSFQVKWLERLLLYHFNDNSNLQARISAFQYGFRARVSTETALHEFARRIDPFTTLVTKLLGQMLTVRDFNQHLVSSFKTIRPNIPRGARCMGHCEMM